MQKKTAKHITDKRRPSRSAQTSQRTRKSSISKASSYEEIGEFWDTHDFTEFADQLKPVQFEVDLQSSAEYFPVESTLAAKLRKTAKRQGMSATTLVNLWVQEKLRNQRT
jgi:hypothetical protein